MYAIKALDFETGHTKLLAARYQEYTDALRQIYKLRQERSPGDRIVHGIVHVEDAAHP